MVGIYAHSSADASPAVKPFTATVITKMYNNDQLKHTEKSTDMVRADGSSAFFRDEIDGVQVGTGVIIDFASKTRTAVDPITDSKTTYHLSRSSNSSEIPSGLHDTGKSGT
jgi:hypothetical protein